MFYNRYITKNVVKTYHSKIFFLSLNRDFPDLTSTSNVRRSYSTKKYNLLYVIFDNPFTHLNGYYNITDFYIQHIKGKNEKSKYINSISDAPRYFTNIKIIKDYENPQLNGKVMLFKMSLKMYKDVVNNFKFDKIYDLVIRVDNFPKLRFSSSEEQLNVKDISDTEIPINFNFRDFSEEFYKGLTNRISLNNKLKKIKSI